MDPDLMLIFGFILVVLSIVFPFAYFINKREHMYKERKLELVARAEEAKAEQMRYSNGDYSKMEERVRVLERIATDSNHTLASQIEELRALDRIEVGKPEVTR
ncbi:hypothetical protein P8Q88_01825 [Qipengyuania sp. XHP0207]|uniref:hypothetical protein n=1 Tax=Qipengyuania sp. XHP0207 TaxID=3038078 RepID=UPI00241C34EB|nr:hypothetical protein [Qipengyuania sp. XHP0207]MDG5746904.1 hypothetical protein [Qipengyuania sp. XHP0207]